MTEQRTSHAVDVQQHKANALSMPSLDLIHAASYLRHRMRGSLHTGHGDGQRGHGKARVGLHSRGYIRPSTGVATIASGARSCMARWYRVRSWHRGCFMRGLCCVSDVSDIRITLFLV